MASSVSSWTPAPRSTRPSGTATDVRKGTAALTVTATRCTHGATSRATRASGAQSPPATSCTHVLGQQALKQQEHAPMASSVSSWTPAPRPTRPSGTATDVRKGTAARTVTATRCTHGATSRATRASGARSPPATSCTHVLGQQALKQQEHALMASSVSSWTPAPRSTRPSGTATDVRKGTAALTVTATRCTHGATSRATRASGAQSPPATSCTHGRGRFHCPCLQHPQLLSQSQLSLLSRW